MPNPVAEVVERLRAAATATSNIHKYLADTKSDRNRASGDEGACYQFLSREQTLEWQAADLIERLSGVPEGFWLAPHDATNEMVAAALAVNWEIEDEAGLVHNVYHAMMAAAPQPTTVSPDIVALTRERDQAREALAVSNTAAEMLRAQITLLGHVPCVVKSIDSLLNPEKEEKA